MYIHTNNPVTAVFIGFGYFTFQMNRVSCISYHMKTEIFLFSCWYVVHIPTGVHDKLGGGMSEQLATIVDTPIDIDG